MSATPHLRGGFRGEATKHIQDYSSSYEPACTGVFGAAGFVSLARPPPISYHPAGEGADFERWLQGYAGRIFKELPMRDLIPSAAIISTIFVTLCCRNVPTTVPSPPVQVKVEDVGATVAWLRLSVPNVSACGSIVLSRDGQKIFSSHSIPLDTILIEDSLLPNHTYKYAAIYRDGLLPDETSTINLTTMDSTVETYVWNTYTFGGGDDSYFDDVFVFDHSQIWAVGEISIRDSSGNLIMPPFNVARWDGSQWDLQSVAFEWDSVKGFASAVAVFGFTPDEVLVSSGASVMHWNGSAWSRMGSLELGTQVIGSVNTIWGTGISNLVGVGLNGSIVRWNGMAWDRIESGTTTTICDVWGVTARGGYPEVYCAVSDIFAPKDRKILKLVDTNVVDTVGWNPAIDVLSVWAHNQYSLYACGLGIFENRGRYWKQADIGINSYMSKIRGDGLNDIFVVGASGFIAHYNGCRWTVLNGGQSVNYVALGVIGDLVAAAGFDNGRAVITVGKRNIGGLRNSN